MSMFIKTFGYIKPVYYSPYTSELPYNLNSIRIPVSIPAGWLLFSFTINGS